MCASISSPTDGAPIGELLQTWANAVRGWDIDGTVAHHAPDFLLFDVPPPVQSRGLDEYKKSWEEQFFLWFGDSGVFELSELTIAAGDNVGFCHGLIRSAGSAAPRDNPQLVVRLTICYRKTNGQWTVVHEHHSEPSADA